jgi:hypothetical protein
VLESVSIVYQGLGKNLCFRLASDSNATIELKKNKTTPEKKCGWYVKMAEETSSNQLLITSKLAKPIL